ncbi:MAG: hypothetical protein M9949_11460 [Candidatus Kapabacteria bacterium]|nr:hypothetical protein [Candidatus Kapabacteria bacterium]
MNYLIFLILFFNIQLLTCQENDKYIKFNISCEYDTWLNSNSIYFIDSLGNKQGIYIIDNRIHDNNFLKISNQFNKFINENTLNISIKTKIGIEDSANTEINGMYEGEKNLKVYFTNDSTIVNYEWKLKDLKPVMFKHGDY